MSADEPRVNANSRYSINQTCELLGVHRDTLYKYTHKTCELKCGWRIISGRMVKFYLGSDILKFWKQSVGFK